MSNKKKKMERNMADPATVVIDNGTGYTKMGYAGNMEPSYLIPSVIAKSVPKVSFIPDAL